MHAVDAMSRYYICFAFFPFLLWINTQITHYRRPTCMPSSPFPSPPTRAQDVEAFKGTMTCGGRTHAEAKQMQQSGVASRLLQAYAMGIVLLRSRVNIL
jgi:hypothetical protein